jgi:RNA polymerase sigma-70 factor (ECF subfamily)
LARKAIKGDRVAFEELCKKESVKILLHAYAILGNHHDAEDVAQETILFMYRYIGTLRAPEAIDAWALKITVNRCYRYLEKRNKTVRDLNIDDENVVLSETDEDYLPERYAENGELSEKLYNIVLDLPPKRRQAIIMYYYDNLKVKEIAEIIGTDASAVTSTLTKARRMIRNRIDKEAEGAVFGAGAAAPVISRVLAQQVPLHYPNEYLMGFHAKWSAALGEAPAAAAKAAGLKTAIGVAASAVVFAGAIFAVAYFDRGAVGAVPETVATVTRGDIREGNIVFLDGDCACGHVNPKAANLELTDGANDTVTWRIVRAETGLEVFAGEGVLVSDAFTSLIEAGDCGYFTLIYPVTTEDGRKSEISRDFEIRGA